MSTDHSGVDLYLSLTDADRTCIAMFVGCTFGGAFTLPSGLRVTGAQMESLQKSADLGGEGQ